MDSGLLGLGVNITARVKAKVSVTNMIRVRFKRHDRGSAVSVDRGGHNRALNPIEEDATELGTL